MDWTVMMSTYNLLIVLITLLIVGDSAVTQNVPRTFISHDVTTVNLSDVVHHSVRLRRGSQARPLTRKEIVELVELHNELRAREGAVDMELITWNNRLASQAAKWAAKCTWGQAILRAEPDFKEEIGQNVWAVEGNTITVTDGIHAFYNEKQECEGEDLAVDISYCANYTQLVWSTTRQIGCAVHRCEPLVGKGFNFNAMYLVCNYGPAGNWEGEKPFIKGPPCSNCSIGAGWCKNKLCDNTCLEPGANCPWSACAAHCRNCAKLNKESCRCRCASGWYGPDCSHLCANYDKKCNNEWSPSTCNDDKSFIYVRAACPAMCRVCIPNPDSEEGVCLPVHGPAAYLSAPTMLMKSHHVMMMFVMIIITVNISNLDDAL